MSGAGLNLAQLQAVNHLHGPCLVLAGAGSGKTRVITHKIARLIGAGVGADRIAAITFTNKAAAEMRERARALIGRAAGDVIISTFHALGVRLLREDGAAIGLAARFSILDADDVLAALKECGATTDNAVARQWQWTISGWKNAGLDSAAALARASGPQERACAEVMARYEQHLSAWQAVDFDDLIGLPLRLLQTQPAVAERWRQRLAHVLIDEVQDTNAVQYELLKCLVGPSGSFTAVGDDDQSIYGWRGATLDNLRRLPQDYPALAVIKLEQNYRSTSAILRAANHVIEPNPKLFAKRLFSELGEGEPVRVLDADDETHEAERAVQRLRLLRETSPHKAWRDFAILYRANHQARVFEQALRRAQIPYRVSGGTSFFDRAEVRDLTAWMRVWANPNDDLALLRAITVPRRGIGAQTLGTLRSLAARLRLSLFDTLAAPSLASALPTRAVHGLHEFGRQMLLWQQAARGAVGASDARRVLQQWLHDIGYEQHLKAHENTPQAAAARWANVQDFCDWLASRCADATDPATGLPSPERSLLDVAQTIALLSTLQEREGDSDVVTLSTLHAAKGLEWPHVLLVGCVEGLLPFRSEAEDAAALDARRIEEERRLMYVGITRAQRTLAVSWSRQRRRQRRLVPAQPSRFIAEMALEKTQPREDPRARLQALREQFARKIAATGS